MRRLFIDTTTPWLSVALFDGGALLAGEHRAIGRGHAEALVPVVAALPDGGRADEICVGCGPGSFTGLRVGIAAARALGFAWGVPVHGFDSLALTAVAAAQTGGAPVDAVVSSGGHGEWLVWTAPMQGQSMTPDATVASLSAGRIAGDCAAACVAARGWGEAVDAAPDCRVAPLLPEAAMLAVAVPLYARAPDAALPGAGGTAR